MTKSFDRTEVGGYQLRRGSRIDNLTCFLILDFFVRICDLRRVGLILEGRKVIITFIGQITQCEIAFLDIGPGICQERLCSLDSGSSIGLTISNLQLCLIGTNKISSSVHTGTETPSDFRRIGH